jgi:hypothetical protein
MWVYTGYSCVPPGKVLGDSTGYMGDDNFIFTAYYILHIAMKLVWLLEPQIMAVCTEPWHDCYLSCSLPIITYNGCYLSYNRLRASRLLYHVDTRCLYL